MRKLLELLKPDWRLSGVAISAMGLLHICATLAAPHTTVSEAYTALAQVVPLHRMKVMPPVSPETQKVPFMGPDARYSMCKFDTSDGSVYISASLPAPGWVLALYSPAGENFYLAVAPPGRKIDVALKLVASEGLFAGTTPEARGLLDSGGQTLTVVAGKGIAILRAPDQGQAYRGRNLAEMRKASCSFKPLL